MAHTKDNNTTDQEQKTHVNAESSNSENRSHDGNIEAFMKVAREKISSRRQLEIETAMMTWMTWMIDDC
ncbi:4663_t:CDS:2 [Cetraspora pellucida]|uniref:4663_t:CDS:1 n=1 Tax=Cetraspora pellucida TaxID=1433469 RepID=A0ACA9M5M2_9GLOM|nr:4663_t:CDS:2 [Cetraspora pellucida]